MSEIESRSQVLRKLTMNQLLDRYALMCVAADIDPRAAHASRHRFYRNRVLAEIERRHAAAIEAGGSEVRYALEGES